MTRPMFTPAELAELAAADAEIDSSFELSEDEAAASRMRDYMAQGLTPSQIKERERQHRYYEKNRERKLQSMRDYRQSHKEEIAACKKRWYQENKERIQAQHREYFQRNKAARAAYQRSYRERKKAEKNGEAVPAAGLAT